MAEGTNISWCDATINWWIGCTKVSPACDHCYAENLMDTRYGRVEWGAPGKGNGTRVRTSPSTWNDPIRWNRKAERDGTRPFVFSSSLSDIFDKVVPHEWRRDAFDVMRRTPHLVYLLLTKRPQLIVRLSEEAGGLPLNAAIGTTVEDQPRVEINIPHLLQAAAELHPLFTFASCEPLLAPINLRHINLGGDPAIYLDALTGHHQTGVSAAGFPNIQAAAATLPRLPKALPPLGWAITGGETDQGKHRARPTPCGAFQSVRDQCAMTSTPYHHKQNGEYLAWSQFTAAGIDDDPEITRFDTMEWHEGRWENIGRPMWCDTVDGAIDDEQCVGRVGKKRAGRLLDGVEHNGMPEVRR